MDWDVPVQEEFCLLTAEQDDFARFLPVFGFCQGCLRPLDHFFRGFVYKVRIV